jgi:hypothetical protein
MFAKISPRIWEFALVTAWIVVTMLVIYAP